MTHTRNATVDGVVDANVLIYSVDISDDFKRRRAQHTLKYLWERRMGAVTCQVLGEFFNTVIRKIPQPLEKRDAGAIVADYVRSWTVLDLTPSIVLEAVRGVQRHQLSYWDALIWATAKLNGARYILSEDMRTGAVFDGVQILNPLDPDFDIAVLHTDPMTNS